MRSLRNSLKLDEMTKTRRKRNDELFRIFDNNELPSVIITGLYREDGLDLIGMAAAEGWETTGRAPLHKSNHDETSSE